MEQGLARILWWLSDYASQTMCASLYPVALAQSMAQWMRVATDAHTLPAFDFAQLESVLLSALDPCGFFAALASVDELQLAADSFVRGRARILLRGEEVSAQLSPIVGDAQHRGTQHDVASAMLAMRHAIWMCTNRRCRRCRLCRRGVELEVPHHVEPSAVTHAAIDRNAWPARSWSPWRVCASTSNCFLKAQSMLCGWTRVPPPTRRRPWLDARVVAEALQLGAQRLASWSACAALVARCSRRAPARRRPTGRTTTAAASMSVSPASALLCGSGVSFACHSRQYAISTFLNSPQLAEVVHDL